MCGVLLSVQEGGGGGEKGREEGLCVCTRMEVRGQLGGLSSFFLSCGFLESNPCGQSCTAKLFH